ncbi:S1/P1 nuclease [Phenylobacterium sp.]|uniref:S1/P1 nuclease n=1 Tax=Phenylobacterium sp. TaxID=1871053 RepID=UPI002F40ABB8
MRPSATFRALGCSAVAAALAACPTAAGAWGDQGHEIIAALAKSYLKPAVLTKVNALLAAHQDNVPIAADMSTRATWADKYRDQDRPTGPQYLGTRNWHFVDTPLATPTSNAAVATALAQVCPHPTLNGPASLGAPPDDCVVDKIKQFEAELADKTVPQPERVFALEFLLHFVGDVHQPLHATDDNDRGGNCVLIHGGPNGQQINLHAYWDTRIIEILMNGATPTDYANSLKAQITPGQKAAWETDDATAWAIESFKVGKAKAYKLNVAPLPSCANPNHGASVIMLPANYESDAAAAAKLQLEKAGVRLAFILNKALS